MDTAPARGIQARGRPWTGLVGALGIYTAASILLLGTRVVAHPGTSTLGVEDFDFSQFVWFVAWWPDALLAGHDILHTTFLFAPAGYNLAWATSVPGPALVVAPITLLAGPVVALNVLALAAPVAAALSAYVLCRYVTGSEPAALAGGAAFGFSAFLIGNEQVSAVHVMYVAVVPLAVWLVLRRLDGRIGTGRFVASFAACLIGQFLISPEMLANATVLGALALAGLFAAAARLRPRLRGLIAALIGAYAIGAAVVSPWLYAMFAQPHLKPAFGSPDRYAADLLSFVVPSPPEALGASSFTSLTARFSGGPVAAQHGLAYLGLPLLLVMAVAVFPCWRGLTSSVALRFAAAVTALAALLSLGPELGIAGHRIVPLPWWALADRLPLLRYAIPARFAAFTALGAAVILAIWLATHPSVIRWAPAAVALLFLVPSPSWFGRRISEPAVYRDGAIAGVLHHNDVVLPIPMYGESMRWQADTGMAYRLAGGYAGALPSDYLGLYCELGSGITPATFHRFLRSHDVTALLAPAGFAAYLKRLDPQAPAPTHVGDQIAIRLGPPLRALPRAAIATAGASIGDCSSNAGRPVAATSGAGSRS